MEKSDFEVERHKGKSWYEIDSNLNIFAVALHVKKIKRNMPVNFMMIHFVVLFDFWRENLRYGYDLVKKGESEREIEIYLSSSFSSLV